MTIVPVIMASIVPLIVGSLVFYLFERFTGSGFKIFPTIALILMVLSLASPFTVILDVTVGYYAVFNQFRLEAGKEAFRLRLVVTIAASRH